ncbi:MAG: DUF6328 family protein [Burkholderiales bacterium]
MDDQASQQDKNEQEMRDIIEEARCILPGLQAVFGFQTIAVFNKRFTDLATYAQVCHLVGLGLMVVAMAMLMTPAVYNRAKRGQATSRMLRMSRKSIRGGLIPLAVGLSLDMLTVMSLATDMLSLSIAAAVATLLLFMGLWYFIPRSDPAQVAEPRS